MCRACGHPTKPACDSEPDCPRHCCGDEHESLDQALDEFTIAYWDDPPRWRLMVLEVGSADTPSHMNAAADLEGRTWAEEFQGALGTSTVARAT